MEQITVIMPVYNAELHLSAAIESVLGQSYEDFKLIIVNDGSTDGSTAIIAHYSKIDPRILSLYQENRGMADALNRGLKEARTEWVVRMDQDDEMLSNRIERQLDFVQVNPDVKVASCRAVYIDDSGKEFGKTANHLRTRADYRRLVRDNEAIGLLHPGVIMHRETILEVGGYRGQFWPAEDIDLWCRVSEEGHLILIQDEVLMKYRIYAGSTTTADFRKSRLQYEWVRSCMGARKKNEPEPDRETFLREWHAAPIFLRINRQRKALAKYCYRNAGHLILTRRWLKGISYFALASLLQPGYVFPRLKDQLGKTE